MSSRAQLTELARLVALVASDLEHRGYQASAVVRRGAQALTEAAAWAPDDDSACPGCGGPVEQPELGRRRSFCSTSCRKRHTRAESGRNGSIAA